MGDADQLSERLKELGGSKTLIIGIGNTLKGDDGLGPLVCERLAGKTSAEVIDCGTVPENYIQRIIRKAPEVLLVVDAIDFGGSPGAIETFEIERLDSVVISTHTMSPRMFVDMIRKSIEVDVLFIGIQPEHTHLGEAISDKVANAAEMLAGALTKIFPSDSD